MNTKNKMVNVRIKKSVYVAFYLKYFIAILINI